MSINKLLQSNDNKQLLDPILRISLHFAYWLDLYNWWRVVKQLLHVQSSRPEHSIEEEIDDLCEEGAFLCIFEWQSLCNQWV